MSSNNRGSRRGGTATAPQGQRIVDPVQAFKRLERQFRTDAEKLLSQHSCLSQARQVYSRGGVASVEVLLDQEHIKDVKDVLGEGHFGAPLPRDWVSWSLATSIVDKVEDGKAIILALGRRSERLGEKYADVPWAKLTAEQRRILRLSNRDFRSFRGTTNGGTTQVGQVQPGAQRDSAAHVGRQTRHPEGSSGPPQGGSGGGSSSSRGEQSSPRSPVETGPSPPRGGQGGSRPHVPSSGRNDPFQGLGNL